MHPFLYLPTREIDLMIRITADKLNLSRAIVEKDMWVCILLDYLFNEFEHGKFLAFKGGTSLSKVYKLIQRFSEDIDIAINPRLIGYDGSDLYRMRSNSAQLKFIRELNCKTSTFIEKKLLPHMNDSFQTVIDSRSFKAYIDPNDPLTICFKYPNSYHDDSILQIIRIEMGCLAGIVPSSTRQICTYIEEANNVLDKHLVGCLTVSSLRSFYEKLTILHKEANRYNRKLPQRYSRHYYDVYKMLQTDLYKSGLDNLTLLFEVVDFNTRFYNCRWAEYHKILTGDINLSPNQTNLVNLIDDYESMQSMLFGEIVPFWKIVNSLERYQKKLNKAILQFIT